MIPELAERFQEKHEAILECFKGKHPQTYQVVLEETLKVMFGDDGEYGTPDYNHVHEIDDGDYQGTLVFIVPEKGYQPHRYFLTKVFYGSCSGCDTIQGIYADGDYGEIPSESQAKDYAMLALHMIQNMVEV
jgi:hypothetical protein